MSMSDIFEKNIKFFKHDIISGKAEKVGDKFTALMFGMKESWIVKEIHGECFYADMVK